MIEEVGPSMISITYLDLKEENLLLSSSKFSRRIFLAGIEYSHSSSLSLYFIRVKNICLENFDELLVSFSLSNLGKRLMAYLDLPLISPEGKIFLIFKRNIAVLAHQNSPDGYS